MDAALKARVPDVHIHHRGYSCTISSTEVAMMKPLGKWDSSGRWIIGKLWTKTPFLPPPLAGEQHLPYNGPLSMNLPLPSLLFFTEALCLALNAPLQAICAPKVKEFVRWEILGLTPPWEKAKAMCWGGATGATGSPNDQEWTEPFIHLLSITLSNPLPRPKEWKEPG